MLGGTMRKFLFFLFIIMLIFCLFAATAMAQDAFKPSNATASEQMIATVLTMVVGALFIVCCVMLGIREGNKDLGGGGKSWTAFLLAAVLAVVLRVIVALTFEGYSTDIACFKGWAVAAYEQGPANFYTYGGFSDYPPGYMYVLYVLGFLRELFAVDAASATFTLMIKLPSIIAEVITAVLVYRIAEKHTNNIFALLCGMFLLFNPAMFFNSSAWGQIDAVFILFIALAILYLKKENYILGALFFTISLLIKPQAIMFAPVVGLAYIFALLKKGQMKKALAGIFGGALVAAAVMFIVIYPFTGSQPPMWIIDKYAGTVNFYPYASLNAFNIYTLVGANFAPSTESFLFLNYEILGIIFIVLICAVTVIVQYRSRERRPLFDISAFLILSVFMLAHAMHERYILPVCVLLIFAYVYSRDRTTLFFAGAFSITALLNQMVTLYAAGVVAPELPAVILSALNITLYVVYAIITIKKLTSGNVLIKSPALHS